MLSGAAQWIFIPRAVLEMSKIPSATGSEAHYMQCPTQIDVKQTPKPLWDSAGTGVTVNKSTDQSVHLRQKVSIHFVTFSLTKKIPLRLFLSSLERSGQCFQSYRLPSHTDRTTIPISHSFLTTPCTDAWKPLLLYVKNVSFVGSLWGFTICLRTCSTLLTT